MKGTLPQETINENKQNPLMKHFIFSVSPATFKRSPVLYRIGIKWQTLLGDIPISELSSLFEKELKALLAQFTNISLSKKMFQAGFRLDKPTLIKFCNYIYPADKWIQEINTDIDLITQKFSPRIIQLLASGLISSWISGQIIDNFLAKIAELYRKDNVFQWIGLKFLNDLINTFAKSLKDGSPFNNKANFFSFIFNQCQEAFIKDKYDISVTIALFEAKLSINFLHQVYFSHSNNESARMDLKERFFKNKFNKEFYRFCRINGYDPTLIQVFVKEILPLITSPKSNATVKYLTDPSPVEIKYRSPVKMEHPLPVEWEYASPYEMSYPAPVQMEYSSPYEMSYPAPVQMEYSSPYEMSYFVPVEMGYASPYELSYPVSVEMRHPSPFAMSYPALGERGYPMFAENSFPDELESFSLPPPMLAFVQGPQENKELSSSMVYFSQNPQMMFCPPVPVSGVMQTPVSQRFSHNRYGLLIGSQRRDVAPNIREFTLALT